MMAIKVVQKYEKTKRTLKTLFELHATSHILESKSSVRDR